MVWDSVWEKVFAEHEWGKYPSEDIIRFVARNFYGAPDRRAVKILEVGCGPGANLWFAAREGFSVYGIDGSVTAVALAKARLDGEYLGWQGELLVGDMEKLPYDDASFDGVIDSEAVCANPYENALAIYREMWRVTKPGGKLYSKTFAVGCVGEGTGKRAGHNAWRPDKGPLAGNGDRYTRFTAYEEIPRLLKGWQNISVNLAAYTTDGAEKSDSVKEWIITAEKPGNVYV